VSNHRTKSTRQKRFDGSLPCDWRFIPACMLLESIVNSEAFDLNALVSLHAMPDLASKDDEEEDHHDHASDWSNAMNAHLHDKHDHASATSALAFFSPTD